MKMKHLLPNMIIVLGSLFLSSCSVFMASQERGTSAEELQKCMTRTCLTKTGVSLISQKTNKHDVLVEEIYEVQKPTKSTGRAVAHGALDVATLGLWEVAGTPTEAILSMPDKYRMEVFYKANGEDIKSIRIFNPK